MALNGLELELGAGHQADVCADSMVLGLMQRTDTLEEKVDQLFELLSTNYETSMVPGRFFGAPRHFRIGIGSSTETVSGGLQRLGAALDQLRAAS